MEKEAHMGAADIVVLVFCILAGIAFVISD